MAAGSLLLTESRKIARLLLEEPSDEDWSRALLVENILQKKSPASAIRLARLIRNRLTLMSPPLWTFVAEGNKQLATQSLLAAAVKHGRLLGEFMRIIIKRHVRAFDYQLQANEWRNFLEECALIDPNINEWSQTTRAKIGQVVFRILAEARYLESSRSPRILPVRIEDELKTYLVDNNEHYVLSCLEMNS
jgi:hypothetical protein